MGPFRLPLPFPLVRLIILPVAQTVTLHIIICVVVVPTAPSREQGPIKLGAAETQQRGSLPQRASNPKRQDRVRIIIPVLMAGN